MDLERLEAGSSSCQPRGGPASGEQMAFHHLSPCRFTDLSLFPVSLRRISLVAFGLNRHYAVVCLDQYTLLQTARCFKSSFKDGLLLFLYFSTHHLLHFLLRLALE